MNTFVISYFAVGLAGDEDYSEAFDFSQAAVIAAATGRTCVTAIGWDGETQLYSLDGTVAGEAITL